MRRESGTSNKWNNRSLEEDTNNLGLAMADNRRRFNLSCCDKVQSRSKDK